jgi:hypothetical protein
MNNSLPLFAHFYPPHINANSTFDNLLKNVTKMKQCLGVPYFFLGLNFKTTISTSELPITRVFFLATIQN